MTTKEFFKTEIWKYLTPLIIGFIVGILINIPSCKKVDPEIKYIPVHDTVTIKKDSIIYKTKPVEVYFRDTFYIKESGDTVKLDSIPITQYKYQDTISTDSTSTEIMINFHGFDAEIDSINLVHNYFNKQEIIVKEPKKVGLVWFVGFYGGYGGHGNINAEPHFDHGPEIGVGAGIGIGGIIK